MKFAVLAILWLSTLCFVGLTACSRKPEASGPERRYQLSGRVVALDAAHQTATIDAAAVPNFMEAMTMEYPIKSKMEFAKLHVGDNIRATLNVTDAGASYSVSDIQKQTAGK